MKSNARQKLLAYLRKNHSATADEAGRAMGVTSANARHHLAGLAADGLAEVIGLRRSEGKGRPVKVFGLSRVALGDNFALLSEIALEGWFASLAPEQRESALKLIAEHLAGLPFDQKLPITRRLGLAAERLDSLHYRAHWEAHAGGARVILGHCPYAAIIGKHPELCRMDGLLLELMVGAGVEQIAKLEITGKGLPVCVFSVAGSHR